jgi:hypothetical protein
MKPSTINEVIGMPDKFLIPAVQGTIKFVYPRETKQGNYGEYTSQNFVLEDESGDIRVTAMDHPDLTTLKGKRVTLAAGKDGKGQWSGLKKSGYQSTKTGEFIHQIQLGKIGKILDEVTEAAHAATGTKQTYAPAPQAPRASHSAANQGQYTPSVQPGIPTGHLSIAHTLNKMANAYLESLQAAVYVAKHAKEQLGVEFNAEDIRQIATTLKIDATNTGVFAGIEGGLWHKHVRKAEPEPVAPAPEPIKYTGPVAVADADDFGDPPF